MFESRVLDALSRVHPAVPVIIFAPLIAALVAWSLSRVSVLVTVGLFAGGYALWTLFEYWLHRVVFHFEPEKGIGARLHWIIHGVHHDHPNDPLRLVMPPAVSVPLAAIVFAVLYLVFGAGPCAGAGGWLLRGLPGVRHDPLLPAPLPTARLGGEDAARTPHAPPLPGRHQALSCTSTPPTGPGLRGRPRAPVRSSQEARRPARRARGGLRAPLEILVRLPGGQRADGHRQTSRAEGSRQCRLRTSIGS